LELFDLTIHELHDLLKSRKTSSLEMTQSVFKRIKKVEPRVRSYVTLTEEVALESAKKADEEIARNSGVVRERSLHGIPLGIKDNFLTAVIPTTCSSKILGNYKPSYNGTAVQKLSEQGTVMVGKLNLDVFSIGSSTENSSVSVTRNPCYLHRIPGGSS
jgi:aspartyl-tRNA(Asn)/glutamyl-tRNA(Gln) amidotransferase subunit A